MFRKVVCFLVVAAASLAYGSVPALADPGVPVPCDSAALVSALAPGTGVFDLAAGCTYTLTVPQLDGWGLPDVSGDVVINGNGATITRSTDPGTTDFGFFTVAGSLTLNDLTLSNGYDAGSDGSGGVFLFAATLTLDQVNMTNDVSSDFGGAINAASSPVSIQDSTFSGDDGLSFNEALTVDGGSLSVSGSTFADDHTAIDATGVHGMTITDSTFTGNTSPAVEQEGGTLAATGDTFSDNDGIGIVEDVGTLTATGDTFSDNSGRGLYVAGSTASATVTDSTFTGNTSLASGAGILDSRHLVLRSSTITDNVVTAGPGNPFNSAGVGLVVEPGATAEVSGTLIAANQLEVSGQSAQNQDYAAPGTLTDEGYNLEGPGDVTCAFTGAVGDATGNPEVLPLASNGGPTQTQALGPTSAALDRIPPGATDGAAAALCAAGGTDQRGLSRPQGLGSEIGAFEQAAVNLAVLPDQVTSPGSPVTLTATVTPASVQPSGAAAPQGVVGFYDNDALIGTAPLNGSSPDTATLVQSLPGGGNSIAVGYAGDPAGLYSLLAGPPSPSASTVVATPYVVSPDGLSASTVTVTLQDGQADPVRGDTVQVTGTGAATVKPGSPATNAAGVATFEVTDPDTELVTLSATDITASVALTQRAHVDFTAGVPITTLAGGGADGATDGVTGTDAGLNSPEAAVRDPAGNVIIADTADNLVRVVAESDGHFYGQDMTAGDIYTIAGGGVSVSSGVPATQASISPAALAVDPAGNVLVGDQNNLVWVLATSDGHFYGRDMLAGDLYVLAGVIGGGGTVGNGIPATSAAVTPAALAVDSAGNVLIADSANNVIWALAPSDGAFYGQHMTGGDAYIVAGGGSGGLGDGGPATSARLSGPGGISVDGGGNLIIADTNDNAIRVVDESGETSVYSVPAGPGDIVTVAGSPTEQSGYGGDGGPATAATLSGPQGVSVDSAGNLVFADFWNGAVRAVAAAPNLTYGVAMSAGDIYTVAGNPQASTLGDGGPALEATIYPWAVDTYSPGVLLVPDYFAGRVRQVGPIITAPLPPGVVSSTYSATPTVTNTSGAVTWSVSSGSLPPGLVLDPPTGTISGAPTTGGTFDFTLSATDMSSPQQTAVTGPLSIKIPFVIPTVTTISPGTGPAAGGTVVTITGTGFVPGSTVAFGGTAASTVSYVSSTQLTATSPAGSGTVDVTVGTPGGTSTASGADRFSYAAVASTPSVTKINTSSGPPQGGTIVVITGSGFSTVKGATPIQFGGVPATNVSCSSTSCSATSPAGVGVVDITATVGGHTVWAVTRTRVRRSPEFAFDLSR